MTEEQSPEPEAVAKPFYPRRRRRTWLMVVLGMVILLSGMVIGGGLTVFWLQKKLLYMIHHPEDAPATIAAHVQSKFDLSDEQAEKIEQILRTRQKVIQAIRREFQPKIMAELEVARDEVAAVMPPEKAREWQTYYDTMREAWVPPPPGASPEPETKK